MRISEIFNGPREHDVTKVKLGAYAGLRVALVSISVALTQPVVGKNLLLWITG